MENCIRSFSILFFFDLHFCVNLTEENAVLGWEDFFCLMYIISLFLYVDLLSFDIICSAMLCMTHGESAHRFFSFFNVARSNLSQCNIKYQIQINQ